MSILASTFATRGLLAIAATSLPVGADEFCGAPPLLDENPAKIAPPGRGATVLLPIKREARAVGYPRD
jgi:hypothetical protein